MNRIWADGTIALPGVIPLRSRLPAALGLSVVVSHGDRACSSAPWHRRPGGHHHHILLHSKHAPGREPWTCCWPSRFTDGCCSFYKYVGGLAFVLFNMMYAMVGIWLVVRDSHWLVADWLPCFDFDDYVLLRDTLLHIDVGRRCDSQHRHLHHGDDRGLGVLLRRGDDSLHLLIGNIASSKRQRRMATHCPLRKMLGGQRRGANRFQVIHAVIPQDL